MPWGSWGGGTLPGPARGVPWPGGYPGWGGTLPRGVPWLGGTLVGGTLPGGCPTRGVPWLGGTLPGGVPWSGTPPGQVRMGGYPAPGGGYPGRTTEGVLTTRRVVCLLRSRRRTFLLHSASKKLPLP